MVLFNRENLKSEKAAGLLSVLMAVGIGGVLVLALTTMMTNSMKAQKRVGNDADKTAIKHMLLNIVDCEKTLDACNGTLPIKIYRHRIDGSELFIQNSGTGSRFGVWTLRANCNGTDDGVIVRAARLKPGKSLLSTKTSDFQPDPLNNNIYTWNDKETLLFADGIELCSGGSTGRTILGGGYAQYRIGYPDQQRCTSWGTGYCDMTNKDKEDVPGSAPGQRFSNEGISTCKKGEEIKSGAGYGPSHYWLCLSEL